MKYKTGVPVVEPAEKLKQGELIFEKLFKEYFRMEPVCTSTTDGKHKPGSKHYKNPHEARDYRFPEPFRSFLFELKKKLGNKFDLALENDHIHLEVH